MLKMDSGEISMGYSSTHLNRYDIAFFPRFGGNTKLKNYCAVFAKYYICACCRA